MVRTYATVSAAIEIATAIEIENIISFIQIELLEGAEGEGTGLRSISEGTGIAA